MNRFICATYCVLKILIRSRLGCHDSLAEVIENVLGITECKSWMARRSFVLSMEARRRWNIPMLWSGIYVWRVYNTGNGIKGPGLAWWGWFGSNRPLNLPRLMCATVWIQGLVVFWLVLWSYQQQVNSTYWHVGDTTSPWLRLLIFIWHTKHKSYGTVRV